MAFKMKGTPYPKKSPPKHYDVKMGAHDHPHGKPDPSPAKGRKRKLKKGKTLKTEHKDTWVYKGENFREKIVDLEDRIGFIKEDIFNQKGGATAKQKKDIAAMKKRLAALRKQRDKDTDKYSQLNPKNPDRD